MKSKKNFGRTASKITAALLAAAMLLGGTYAWTDYTQHKTNTAAGTLSTYDVTLNDDFKVQEEDWKVGNDLEKNVSVTNRGEGNVYVRLALKEFMSIAEHEYEYSDERYATYSTGANIGKFIVNTDPLSQTDANAWAASLGYTGKAVYLNPAPLDAFPFGYPAGWYIETQFDDIDGQYGKFLTVDIDTDTHVPLAPLAADATHSNNLGDPGHNDPTVATRPLPENAWPLFSFEDGNPNYIDGSTVNADGQIEYRMDAGSDAYWDIRKYVNVLLNSDFIIPYSEWLEINAPVYQWVWNDQDLNDPYIYWGAPLKPGETTQDLVEGLQLIFQPDGHFIYELFVDMQAVSLEQMDDNWGFASDDNNMLYIYTGVPVPPTPKAESITIHNSFLTTGVGQPLFLYVIITLDNGTEQKIQCRFPGFSAGTFDTIEQVPVENQTTYPRIPAVIVNFTRVHGGSSDAVTINHITINGILFDGDINLEAFDLSDFE